MNRYHQRAWMMAALAVLARAPLAAQSAPPSLPAGEWRALVGCYRAGSRSFALDSLPGTNPFQPAGSLQAWSYWYAGRLAHWRPLGGDSVELGSGDSLHGWRFRGVVRGRDLAGVMTPWTDILDARTPSRDWTLVREPCGTDGVTDGPPPDAQMLMDSFPVRMAEIVTDSLLPRLFGESRPNLRYADDPFSPSAAVGRALLWRTASREPGPEMAVATWLYLDDFTLERDSASANVVALSCPETRGSPSTAARRRVRLRRQGSGWALAGIDAEERVEIRCRRALRNTNVVTRW
ncbi:hypothetical protein [Longimicrobium terrae]|uniref:Uncharacterized protein n=1 Tax=Longimicrobium terrae TaxID=1639882 RepID=A0A841H2C7_9BACT|nr:hypothetical protein [Longimicrobium terrae]MBB4637840.1 hypothetical protein [Longimicrobium terrae]MBB6072305.1 hypothetical protein [Longimicrobium terrae]NNC31225.1 hypothetical protein [Longimicrobium terrae]